MCKLSFQDYFSMAATDFRFRRHVTDFGLTAYINANTTEHFAISEPKNPTIDEFHVVQKRFLAQQMFGRVD